MNYSNKKMFEDFKQTHIDEGGEAPYETALTNLVNYSLINRNYKIFLSSGVDDMGKDIEIWDVVLWRNLVNDPFFMVCVDKDSNDCIMQRCNINCEIEEKII